MVGKLGGCCCTPGGICINSYYRIGTIDSFDEHESEAGYYEEFRSYEPAYASYTKSGNTASATGHTINPGLRGYAGGPSNVLFAEYISRGYNFKWEATLNPVLIATLDFEWTMGWGTLQHRQYTRLVQLTVGGVTSQASQSVIENPNGVGISSYTGNTGQLQVVLDATTGINRAWRPAYDGDQNNITSPFGTASQYCDLEILWTIRVLNSGDDRFLTQPFYPCQIWATNLSVTAA